MNSENVIFIFQRNIALFNLFPGNVGLMGCRLDQHSLSGLFREYDFISLTDCEVQQLGLWPKRK